MPKRKRIKDVYIIGQPEELDGDIEEVIKDLRDTIACLIEDCPTLSNPKLRYDSSLNHTEYSDGYSEYNPREFQIEFQRDESDAEQTQRLKANKRKRTKKILERKKQEKAARRLTILWIGENLTPEQVFTKGDLEEWATDNDFELPHNQLED